MNPLWLMTLSSSKMSFELRDCARCGESHELLLSIARTRLHCRKCSAPLSPKKTSKAKAQRENTPLSSLS